MSVLYYIQYTPKWVNNLIHLTYSPLHKPALRF